MSANQYVIFVSYYSKYFEESLNTLVSLSNRISKDAIVVVVNNNPNSNLIEKNNDFDLLVGENSAWEFSAWDQGIQYIEKKYKIKDSDVIIFANDTFCQHRYFGTLDKMIFAKNLKKLYQKDNIVVGDVDSFGESFSILSKFGNKWISTYLFGMRYSTMKKCLPFSSLSYIENEITIENGKIKGIDVSRSLLKHLESWLFPINDVGWYKSQKADENLLKKKLMAILHEKYLSCKLIESNITLVGVYSPFVINLFRKLRIKLI
ncbi:hypothetical protein C0Z01_08500 [Photobacterium kishitanii]|uniref:hypothetical protein n=1 Tax=Photobacterium kishitanii TaxID=318456 RepID=UPI0007EF3B01|nr:hypothetical protein [Photobacterium kishitanii]OBU27812.1 hypothetical protein AYY22_16040 [Photobacterium kishitanii]PSW69994.1 hypothetical protein C0Z01_08500 [Photobacterium kishitanii]